ncbi:MAG: hypothetical protein Q27BPR15_08555 [Rhodobacter sp. CACIA14H1]|nr:MAG: hypothetical protein Q27BPR15_08555 [Rhodobacter sp. CACIA14H1]
MVREYRILDLDLMGDPFTQIPLEQFTSGAAIDGLAEVIRNLPSPVAAWRWLKAPNPRLNGELPINLMRGGRRADLVVALEDDFGIVFD